MSKAITSESDKSKAIRDAIRHRPGLSTYHKYFEKVAPEQIREKIAIARHIEDKVEEHPKLGDKRAELLACRSIDGVDRLVQLAIFGPRKPGRPRTRPEGGETRGLYMANDVWDGLGEAAGEDSRSMYAEKVLRDHLIKGGFLKKPAKAEA